MAAEIYFLPVAQGADRSWHENIVGEGSRHNQVVEPAPLAHAVELHPEHTPGRLRSDELDGQDDLAERLHQFTKEVDWQRLLNLGPGKR